MMRYIARTFEGGDQFYPANDLWKRSQIDYWLDFYGTDFRPKLFPCIGAMFGTKDMPVSEIDAVTKAKFQVDR